MAEDQIQRIPFVSIMDDAKVDTPKSRPTAAYQDEGGIISQIEVWFLAFTRIHRIPVFRKVWLYVALMGVYAVIVDYIVGQHFPNRAFKEAMSAAAFSTVVLGLLLVFRTNAAYARWWEGRSLWGKLVNDSRNLAIKINVLADVADEDKIRFGNLIISFAYSLKHHLRGTLPSASLPGFELVSDLETVHMPSYVTARMWDHMTRWQKSGKIDDFARLQLDTHMNAFMDVCGACERIRNTPLAVSYRAFIRQGITLNLAAVPWYLPPELSIYWALPLILIGTYFMIGLEMIAEGVEEPFGKEGDDLPLDTLCNTIRKSIGEILEVKAKTQFTKSMNAVQVDPLKIKDQ